MKGISLRRKNLLFVTAFALCSGTLCFRSSVTVLPGRPASLPPSSLLAPPTSSSSSTNNRYSHASSSSTSLSMFMGSDGGLLGVGGPEIFTILLVGYFVLGPSDLYKLVKEIGKFIQNIRSLGTDLSTTFESNMENQLEIEELRKAQRELTDAFSFRRSINVDESEAFATTTTTPRPEDAVEGASAAAATSTATSTESATGAPKKRKRIRVKKQEQVPVAAPEPATTSTEAEVATSSTTTANGLPDLEMPTGDPFVSDTSSELTKEEQEEIEKEFDKYTNLGDPVNQSWDKAGDEDTTANSSSGVAANLSEAETAAAQTRFQQQTSNDWNAKVMANEDKLSPLAKVMEMLAVLEKEKMSKTELLEEEFKKRADMEEEYYQKQRTLLEEAAAQVQKDAYSS